MWYFMINCRHILRCVTNSYMKHEVCFKILEYLSLRMMNVKFPSTWHFNNYFCLISFIAPVCDERMDSNIFKCLRPNTVNLYVVLLSDLTSNKCNWYYSLHVFDVYITTSSMSVSKLNGFFNILNVLKIECTNSESDKKLKD
jgi:hypothetical protein